MNSVNVIERLFERAGPLYSLPAVAMKVVKLTDQPQFDRRELQACIENDPALTAKVLRVVNSSLFSPSTPVRDLGQAITLLGAKSLKLLVLGFSLPDEMFSGLEAEVLSRYWRHSLIKAVAARQISEQFFGVPGDEAFLAGLFQEIGTLVLVQQLGEPYVQFLTSVDCEGADLASVETATLGFDHVVLSARLLDHWGLPENLVSAIAAPLDAAKTVQLDGDQRAVTQSLHLAELVARFLASERSELLEEILHTGSLYCNLTSEQLTQLIESVQRQVKQLAEILSLELPEGEEYSKVLSAALKQLAIVAEQAAADSLEPVPTEVQNAATGLTACLERFAGQPMYPAVSPAVDADRPVATVDPAPNVGLENHIAAAVATCRQARQPLSLLLVEFDDFSVQLLTRGPDGAERAIRRLHAVLDRTHGGDAKMVILNDVRFALILAEYERQAAVRLGRRILDSVRRWSIDEAQQGLAAISVSAGLATLAMPPKNFPATELIEAAERCISAAQLSGGDSVKSIEIC